MTEDEHNEEKLKAFERVRELLEAELSAPVDPWRVVVELERLFAGRARRTATIRAHYEEELAKARKVALDTGWPQIAAWALTVLVHRIRSEDEPAQLVLKTLENAAAGAGILDESFDERRRLMQQLSETDTDRRDAEHDRDRLREALAEMTADRDRLAEIVHPQPTPPDPEIEARFERVRLRDLLPGDVIVWSRINERVFETSRVRAGREKRRDPVEQALLYDYPDIQFDSLWYVGAPRPLDAELEILRRNPA